MTFSPLPPERHVAVPNWFSDIIIGSVVIVSSFVPFGTEARAPGTPLTVALMVVAAFILPLRRRFGLVVLGTTLVIFVVGAVFAVISPAFILPVAVAMYGIGSTRPGRVTAIAAGVVGAVVLSASWAFLPLNWFDARVIQQVAFIAFAAALGAAMQSRRAYVAAITERALRAEQTRDSEARRQVAEERLRIARDLHDAVAHQIAVINLHAGVASQALPARPDDAEASLATIREAARSVLSEISDLLRVLRSEPGDLTGAAGSGVRRSSLSTLDRLDELVAMFEVSGLIVRVNRQPAGGQQIAPLTPTVDDVAYRVLYEALTNAHKHGSPQIADVTLSETRQGLVLRVQNPVPALATLDRARTTSGHGLIGMRERLQQVGGTLTAGESNEGGIAGDRVFVLVATLPHVDARARPSQSPVNAA
ncbi:sensor histidine kinase [Subtercola lobariae]|uniref:sensor histidine kinase n=1 Tax=Subtercola lobariae TaxID=1588641 RepID=UPI00166B5F18|nr:histidine kinase [Subtercola lobariae]